MINYDSEVYSDLYGLLTTSNPTAREIASILIDLLYVQGSAYHTNIEILKINSERYSIYMCGAFLSLIDDYIDKFEMRLDFDERPHAETKYSFSLKKKGKICVEQDCELLFCKSDDFAIFKNCLKSLMP